MSQSQHDIAGKTAIVTGGANGIGAETVRHFFRRGANVVIADLPSAEQSARDLISELSPSKALYVPVNILVWKDMLNLFSKTVEQFGQVDIVVANAGLMESNEFYDLQVDSNGDLKEPTEAYRVVDVNLKGTMNTLRLAMHYMRNNILQPETQSRGSVVLVASTSGYFGGTGVVSYITSKHGVVGLLRASQKTAANFKIRVNGIAPFFTPTHITGSYAERWKQQGLPANTTDDVASAIVNAAVTGNGTGQCTLVAGKMSKEVESARTALIPEWIGPDISNLLAEGGKFFDEIGGYPLPKPRF